MSGCVGATFLFVFFDKYLCLLEFFARNILLEVSKPTCIFYQFDYVKHNKSFSAVNSLDSFMYNYDLYDNCGSFSSECI